MSATVTENSRWWKRLDIGVVPLAGICGSGGWIVWNGWIGLGQLCGFKDMTPALPFGVEAYGAYALRAALIPGETAKLSGAVASPGSRRLPPWPWGWSLRPCTT